MDEATMAGMRLDGVALPSLGAATTATSDGKIQIHSEDVPVLPADLRGAEVAIHDEAKHRSLLRLADLERSSVMEEPLAVEGLGGVSSADLMGSARASVVLDRCRHVAKSSTRTGGAAHFSVLDLLPPPKDAESLEAWTAIESEG